MHAKILIGCLGFMALLTGFALAILFVRRRRAVRSRQVRVSAFRTYETEGSMPPEILQASRHFANLFETPTLFYVAVLLALFSGEANWISSFLATLFCLFRMAHSFIHLGSNNVLHRMISFGGSVFVLALLWLYLLGKFFLT